MAMKYITIRKNSPFSNPQDHIDEIRNFLAGLNIYDSCTITGNGNVVVGIPEWYFVAVRDELIKKGLIEDKFE